jgi:Protein of unknown function (DUF3618)
MSDTTGGGTPPKSAEALTEDIERTRQELGETIEALVAKTDVKARVQHRAAEVSANLRSRAEATIGKARDDTRSAKEKIAGPGPEAQAARGVLVYSAVAAAALTGAVVLAWLAVRRRRS